MNPMPARSDAPSFAGLLRHKATIWTLIVLPGFWPLWPLLVTGDPAARADPLKLILHHFGFVAVLLLVCTLALTPLRVLFPTSGAAVALNRHRRLLGVSSAAYALLHVSAHVLYEGGNDPAALPAILETALKKPFQLSGLAAFVILAALAVTSLRPAVRWLGGKRWKQLHRLVYVAVALSAYHQAAAHKVFPPQVVWIFAPLLALEAARVVQQRRRRPQIPAPTP